MACTKTRGAQTAIPLRLVAAELGGLLGLYMAKLAARDAGIAPAAGEGKEGDAVGRAGGAAGGHTVDEAATGDECMMEGDLRGPALLLGRQQRRTFGERTRVAELCCACLLAEEMKRKR